MKNKEYTKRTLPVRMDEDHEDGGDDLGSMLEEAANFIRNSLGGLPFPGGMPQGIQVGKKKRGGKSDTPTLDSYSTDLTAAAHDHTLDPVVGRQREIERVTEILCRRKKNNAVLIGEPGVGKSAIVEGLAQQIADGTASSVLLHKRLLSLDLTGIVAGTRYRGDFEERIKNLIAELKAHKDIIVFIDEIHTMVGAGSASGTMDAANILKPALARGEIQCIGATTLDEYRKSIEKDGALERRFQKVIVDPTSPEDTVTILHNLSKRYQKYHCVRFSDEALEACVRLTERYITDRMFPDKAIDAMDEVGARLHLHSSSVSPLEKRLERELDCIKNKKRFAVSSQNFELAAALRDQQERIEARLDSLQNSKGEYNEEDCVVATEKDVAEVVSMMSGVPVQKVSEGETTKLKHMKDDLCKSVIGQDSAVMTVVKAIQRNRIGLRAPNHPIGAFMFLGPTGVGKTHLAQQLARELFGSDDALIRVDMSEFNESFQTSRLVGAPPGYVGYDEGGQLTERVRRHPYSIVLLDEIEKAHPNVFNMLLQVLDEGRMTDGNGRTIDFRNTIIIMTSNAGTRQLKDFGRGVGFNSAGLSKDGSLSTSEQDREYARSIIQKALARQFSPEFLNRLDEIITFDQLSLEAIKQIIDIELKGLFTRVRNLGYKLRISEKVKEYVAIKGYDVQFGARPLKRAIQTYIEDFVCNKILEGDLKPGDTISITKKDIPC